MTRTTLAREIASRTTARFIEIPRLSAFSTCERITKERRETVARKASALLEAEQQRLIKTWGAK